MPKALHLVITTCLDHAQELPVQRRVFLYRALAEICGNKAEETKLLALAADLETADDNCREFTFRRTLA
jgi:hypothetical protein